MRPDDATLLREYVESRSQAAFAELVRRHVNLVYSAARRQVPSHHEAEDVAQAVFVALADHAHTLEPEAPLAAWLYVVTRRTAIDLRRREARRQAREHAATEIVAMKTATPVWHRIETVLDEAMASLDPADSSALLLRFFENRSLREVGVVLGVSEDAAQKRIGRALERLRGDFARRGIAVTVAGLATDLSAHAVGAAPAALGGTIAAAAGAANQATLHATLAMTTFQKTVVAGGFVLALGGVLYEAHAVRTQAAELAGLRRDGDALAVQLAAVRRQNARVAGELDRRERAAAPEHAALEAQIVTWLTRVALLKELFAQHPEQTIPEMKLLVEKDWFQAVQTNDIEHDLGRREVAMRGLRGLAKAQFALHLSLALQSYVRASGGRLPDDVQALRSYLRDSGDFKVSQVEPAMLHRYAIVHAGVVADLTEGERRATLVEITSYDEEADQRMVLGPGGSAFRNFRDWGPDVTRALRAYVKANAGSQPPAAAQLLPYFNPPLSSPRQEKFLADPAILAGHIAAAVPDAK